MLYYLNLLFDRPVLITQNEVKTQFCHNSVVSALIRTGALHLLRQRDIYVERHEKRKKEEKRETNYARLNVGVSLQIPIRLKLLKLLILNRDKKSILWVHVK